MSIKSPRGKAGLKPACVVISVRTPGPPWRASSVTLEDTPAFAVAQPLHDGDCLARQRAL